MRFYETDNLEHSGFDFYCDIANNNGVATKTLQSIFGNIPTYASGICQTKVEDSSVYNFTAVKDGNNLKIATAGSTFSGKKWVTMIIFGTA